jgi:hypothetical protein
MYVCVCVCVRARTGVSLHSFYVGACVCVYMYVCMCVFVCVRTGVRLHSFYVGACVCLCICVHVCMHECMYPCAFLRFDFCCFVCMWHTYIIHTSENVFFGCCGHTYIFTYTYTCMHTSYTHQKPSFRQLWAYVHIYIPIYIHEHIIHASESFFVGCCGLHTHLSTHIHTWTHHTHTSESFFSGCCEHTYIFTYT